MKCCGVTSYEDWYDISAWPGERWVPESCCRPSYNQSFSLTEGSGDDSPDIDCTKSNDPSRWWDKGCGNAIQMWILYHLHIVGIIGLVIAFLQVFQWNYSCHFSLFYHFFFLQLFGLIVSMLLFCTMKHKQSSHTYKSYSPSIDPSQRHRSTDSYTEE